jgi:hypothetical protein
MGTIMGASFAAVDILRDVKDISAKKSVIFTKLARYSIVFAA